MPYPYPFASIELSFRLFLALCGCACSCVGAVVWEKKVVELVAPADAKTIEVVYHFKNEGQSGITFLPVKTSCGCTAAELPKQTWAPGEAGELKVTFTIGDRLGKQEKIVEVATQDAPSKPTLLTLRVDIPEKVICLDRMLLWKVGENSTEKSAILSAGTPLDISAVEIPDGSNPLVSTSIETVEPGRKYRVVMRPKDTATTRTVHVLCRVRFVNGTVAHLGLYALIK